MKTISFDFASLPAPAGSHLAELRRLTELPEGHGERVRVSSCSQMKDPFGSPLGDMFNIVFACHAKRDPTLTMGAGVPAHRSFEEAAKAVLEAIRDVWNDVEKFQFCPETGEMVPFKLTSLAKPYVPGGVVE